MKTLNVHIDFGSRSLKVGELLMSADSGRHIFSYDPEFISSGLSISPLCLPLDKRAYSASKDSNPYSLHGVFADSLPDAWGRKVQDAEFIKIGIIEPTALERLAFIGRNGIGALSYHPAQKFPKGDEITDLAALRKAAQKILEGNIEEISEQLLRSGGSAGGARSKFLIDIKENNHEEIRYTRGSYSGGYIPVILKVPEFGHDHYQRIEYAYSQIARDAGLDIPESYLIGGKKSELAFFAMKRFDITPDGSRYHAHTLAGLLDIDYRKTNIDASTFLRTIEDVTRDHRQTVEGYKRIVFNYIGSNKDDHAKNFSFIMNDKGGWSLAPAYDIGFSKGPGDLHQMRLYDKLRGAEARDFRNLAEDFDIPKWAAIVEKILSTFETWPTIAQNCGVPEKHSKIIYQKLRENIGRVSKSLRQM